MRKNAVKTILAGTILAGGLLSSNTNVLAQEVSTTNTTNNNAKMQCIIPDCVQWTGVVGANGGLNLRESYSTNSKVLTTIPTSTRVVILGKTNNWFRVKFNGKVGYVSDKYIVDTSLKHTYEEETMTPDLSGQGNFIDGTVRVSSSLTLRSGAGTQFSAKGYLSPNQKVKVGEKVNGFYYVKAGSVEGYASAQFIETKNNKPSTSKPENNKPNGDTSVNTVIGTVVNVTTNLRLRADATTDSYTIGYMLPNEEVHIISETNGFYFVEVAGGKTGYASKNYIKR